jgi:hypothetical protein
LSFSVFVFFCLCLFLSLSFSAFVFFAFVFFCLCLLYRIYIIIYRIAKDNACLTRFFQSAAAKKVGLKILLGIILRKVEPYQPAPDT